MLRSVRGCSHWERAAPGHPSPPIPPGISQVSALLAGALGMGQHAQTCMCHLCQGPLGHRSSPCSAMGLTLPVARDIRCFFLGFPPFLQVAPVCAPVLPRCRAIGAQVLPVAGGHLVWGHGKRGEVAGQPAGQSVWGDHGERAGSGFGSMRARLGGCVRSGSRRWVVDMWQQQERVRTSFPPRRHGEDT